MNKLFLLILGVVLGTVYEWLGIFAGWFLAFIFLPSNINPGVVFIFFPLILCFLTSRYFIKKNMGYFPIIGLCIGFVVGFILLSVAIAGV